MALNFSIFLCPPEPLLQYPCVRAQFRTSKLGSFGEGVFWRRGVFSRDSRDCGNKGESDHFLEILQNLEILSHVRNLSSARNFLAPDMAAPILWAPGILKFFLLESPGPHAHKIPRFRGVLVFGGVGVEVAILFLWARGVF